MNQSEGQENFLLEIPKKYVHSLTHFCRNNHYKFRFENMHTLPAEKLARFNFRDRSFYKAALSFLARLEDLDRMQPEEELPTKKPFKSKKTH